MRRLALVLLLLSACKKPSHAATPQDAYRHFVQAVAAAHQSGDPKGLMDYFDAPTREALAARAKAVAAQLGVAGPVDPGDQLLAGGALAPPVAEVQVLAQTPTAATLKVATDGGPLGTVKMVLEDGRWRIHLDALPGR